MARSWLQSAGRVIRAKPLVLLLPLVLTCLACGLSLWAVLSAADAAADNNRASAETQMLAAASALQNGFNSAVTPVTSCANFASHIWNFSEVQRVWEDWAEDFWAAAPPGAQMLRLSPLGRLYFIYPIGTQNMGLVGFDTLADPLERAYHLEVLEAGNVTTAGPYLNRGVYSIMVRAPVFVENVTTSESFGIAWNATDCPPDLCYKQQTRSKFWGFATMALNWESFVEYSGGPLTRLRDYGLHWQLIRPPNQYVETGWQVVGADEGVDKVPSAAIMVPVNVLGRTWYLYGWRNHWEPAYLVPLLVVVCVVSVTCGMLIFLYMLSWAKHQALLNSLLPKDVIKHAIAEINWSAFENEDTCEEALETLHQGTPAEAMLAVVSDVFRDKMPKLAPVALVRRALLAGADVYQPMRSELAGRLAANTNMDNEVKASLLRQLLGRGSTCDMGDLLDRVREDDHECEEDSDAYDDTQPPGGNSMKSRSRKFAGFDFATPDTLRPSITTEAFLDSHESGQHPSSSGPTATEKASLDLSDPGFVPVLTLSPEGIPEDALNPASRPSHTSDLMTTLDGTASTATTNLVITLCNLSSLPIPDPAFLSTLGSQRRTPPRRVSRPQITIASLDKEPPRRPNTLTGLTLFQSQWSAPVRRSLDMASAMASGLRRPKASKRGSFNNLSSAATTGPQSTATASGKMSPLGPSTAGTALAAGTLYAEGASHRPRHDAAGLLNQVDKPLYLELDTILTQADQWTFDTFALDRASNGRPLSVLGFWLIHQSGLLERLKLDANKLTRFLMVIEDGYKHNPYHNRTHAASVLQALHVVLIRGRLAPGYADDLTLLGCYITAIVHDYAHLGRSNDFLVVTQHSLALFYNDRSPMENHHVAASWALLRHDDTNFLRRLPKATIAKLRKLVIELVLATDMKQHFALVGQFTALHRLTDLPTDLVSGAGTSETLPRSQTMSPGLERQGSGTSKVEKISQSQLVPSPSQNSSNTSQAQVMLQTQRTEEEVYIPVSDSDKILSLQMAMKVADLGHLASSHAIHLQWVNALEQEFYIQGDEERSLGLTISPLCDRYKQGVTKSQVGFFEVAAIPLFQNFVCRFKSAKPLFNLLMKNYRYWQHVQRSGSASAVRISAPGDMDRVTAR